ncbi:aminoacetone oxidase family FAD-binding enzyme [Porphyrobacter algicida]|uniref:Aminoacetone oxidase family FAD-binding enzyme n=1 Tax=Qipengyuania algicida TaxID=1836209 RepID=A0A845AJS2_9SPHN|nr:NAD(P)/FAD-dependent oxidoreductase [Qipengyuania algicida]MXP29689.1 aminoacetone oxidase family FAD-binding enzyme [Qipengyuania algicida]
MSESSFDVIVLGAGAAGLMCAAQAGARGRRVLVLDRAEKPGKKILISGGGRCNFTNIHTAPERFISANPHFAKSALSRYTPHDFIALVDSHGIAWHEKTLGQLFCDGSARQIVELLLNECAKADVAVACDEQIGRVDHSGVRFAVTTQSQTVDADSLVIATGGPSIPKMGSTGYAYDLARQFGLKVVEPRPALVPLTLGGEDVLFRELSGVATPVEARCGKAAFREAALFTHRGLSGPAILQVSSYWQSGAAIAIDFLTDKERDWLLAEKRDNPGSTLRSVLRAALPQRLADELAERLSLDGPLANVPDADLRVVGARLADWRFQPNGTEGFAKAEVTVGGISTAELSSKTMEAKRVPSLFAIGEAVDVTGWLGGYNFQWAWASGWAAGQVA